MKKVFLIAILFISAAVFAQTSVVGDQANVLLWNSGFSGSVTSALNTVFSSFTPDRDITVTRFEATSASTALSGCTTQPIISVTDGTNSVSLTFANSAQYNDTGAKSQNFAGGTKLQLKVTTAGVGCSNGNNFNFVVQYRTR